MTELLAKMIICRILVHVIGNIIRHVKLTNVWKLKLAHAKTVYLVNSY